MKSKSPLALMEQIIMILVFAIAAAICLQSFAVSDRISRDVVIQDQALLVAQSAAELLKHEPRSTSADSIVYYDEFWRPAVDAASAFYSVQTHFISSASPLTGAAEVSVCTADGDVLCLLPVVWQEVNRHG